MFSGSSIAVIRASDKEGDPINFSLDAVGGELLNIDDNGNLTLKEALDREVSAVVDCLQSAFSLKIRLALKSSSAIANHDVVITITD